MMNTPAPHDDDRMPTGSNLGSSAFLFNASFSEPLKELRREQRRNDRAESPERSPATTLARFRHPESGIHFSSRCEAACAALLTRFVEDFKTITGVTYEIPIGKSASGDIRSIDFFVKGVFVEYHPPRLGRDKRHCGDFRKEESWRRFRRDFHQCPRHKRSEFIAEVKAELTEAYTEHRCRVIDENPRFRGKELIVVTSPSDFYYKVMRRFALELPPLEEFLELFHIAKGGVVDTHDGGDKRSPKNRSNSRKR